MTEEIKKFSVKLVKTIKKVSQPSGVQFERMINIFYRIMGSAFCNLPRGPDREHSY